MPARKWIVLSLITTTLVIPARADSISEKRMELLFRPILGARLSLSTDGHYLAYTQNERGVLNIIVMDLDRLETKTRIEADEDRLIVHSKEKERASLRFLEWADGKRLVFAPTIQRIESAARPPSASFLANLPPEARGAIPHIPPVEPIVIAPIQSVDADGGNPRELANASTFEAALPGGDVVRVRARPPSIIGFAPDSRDDLLISVPDSGTDVGSEVYRLNVQTGDRVRVSSDIGSGYLYDHQGRRRLQRISERDGSYYFLYRAPLASRWEKLPEPPEAGAHLHFVPTPKTYFGERIIPLGFDYDPNVLLYGANVHRDTFGVYGFDLTTHRRTTLALEHPGRDLVSLASPLPWPGLVFDKFKKTFVGINASGPQPLSVWLDADLASVQRDLEERFPQRSVRILDWNENRTRFIARVIGGTDPGRVYLYRRTEELAVELMRDAPWLPNAELHPTRYFEFAGSDGLQLSAFLTLPRAPKLNPPPVVICFAAGLPPEPQPQFDPQAQVFADMGFIVCRLNQRGVLGLGAKHRDALRRDPDRGAAADALAAIEWIAQRHRIDRKRVAVFGSGFGGLLALRATQLHPEVFRCAVTFDPIFNLMAWLQPAADLDASRASTFSEEVNRIYFEGAGAKLRDLSITAHGDDLNAPVFIAAPAVPRNASETTTAAGISALRSQLKRRDIACVLVDYNDDFTAGLPAARARVYRQLEEFFNLNLYNYNVKIGPTRVVK